MDVSKSSINGVLKESRLSSPVGRHPRAVSIRNFFIPQEKKNNLLSQVKPFLLEKEPVQDFPAAAAPVEEPLGGDGEVCALTLPPDILASDRKSEEGTHEEFVLPKKKERVSVLPRILKIWGVDEDIVYEKAGIIFMLAAWWQMARFPRMGELLAKSLGLQIGAAGEQLTWSSLEGIIFMEALGVEDIRNTYQMESKMFSALLSSGKVELGALLADKVMPVQADGRMAWEMESALAGTLTNVSCFELETREGRKLYMDAFLSVFLDQPVNTFKRVLPMFRAIELLADRLVNNIEPLVLIFSAAQDPFEKLFAEGWGLLAGNGRDAIDKITAHTEDGRSFVVFEHLPAISRALVLMGPASDRAMAAVDIQDISDGLEYYCPLTEKRYSYLRGQTVMSGGLDQAFLVDVPKEPVRRLILSNISSRVCSATDIIGCLARTPAVGDYLQAPEVGDSGEGQEFPAISAPVRYADIFSHISVTLHTRVAKTFFPDLMCPDSDAFRKKLYGLSGQIKNHEDGLLIRLKPPADNSFLTELTGAVARVNALDVRDQQGRKVFLSLDTP